MSRADVAFERLNVAMQTVDPECVNDGRFILDDQPAETLAPICRACPPVRPLRHVRGTSTTQGRHLGRQAIPHQPTERNAIVNDYDNLEVPC